MIFNRNIVLEDSRILLRPVEPNDRDGLRSIFFDDEIWEYTVTKTSTEDELTTFINDALYNKQNAVRYTFTIIDKISGEIAGSSSFGNLSEIDRCVEIGWSFMGRKFWGTHVNIHAKFQMLQFAFEQMKMNRVEFKTDDANPRSGRALIKIGCKKKEFSEAATSCITAECVIRLITAYLRMNGKILKKQYLQSYYKHRV